jgi:quercetin dioxygenase-like cupin family protein
LHVLGTQVRFLCEADKTARAWSLMEVTLPLGAGPPVQEHSCKEGCFVAEGELDVIISGAHHRGRAGRFVDTPGVRRTDSAA